MNRSSLRAAWRGMMVVAAATFVFAGGAEAQQRQNFRFALNFAFDGSNAPYMLAAERGYFAAEGINITLDSTPGGTAEAVTRVASGTYDASFADVNFLVDFNAKNPAKTLRSVYVVYNRSPLAIITLKKSGIAKPADLKGRSLGAPAGDGAFRLFPLFSKVTGIALADVKTQTMDMRLREAMLIKGEVDAVTGFDSSVWFIHLLRRLRARPLFEFGHHDAAIDARETGAAARLPACRHQGLSGFTRRPRRGDRGLAEA
jgi:NitT/TauT family transport system substrate-binding protein